MSKQIPIEARKLVRFVFWGACSYLLAFSVMYVLTRVLGMANKPGYAVTQAVILPVNFLLNRYLVFSSTSQGMFRQSARYLAVNVTMRFVDWLVFAFAEGILGLPDYVAIGCGLCCAYPLKFAAYRIGVFGDDSPPSEAAVPAAAEDGGDYVSPQGKMALLPEYYRWMFGYFHEFIRGKVVELGSGQGHGIPFYLDSTESILAVDSSAELLEQLEKRLASEKIKTARADLNDDWDFAGDGTVDTFMAMDILEHLEDDGKITRQIAAKLRPGGRLVVKVPAQSRLYGPMDEASGHARRYDRGRLTALMADAGLVTEFCRHVNPLGALTYALRRKRRTNLSKTFTRGQLRIINRLMPLLSILDAVPGLRGLSLVGVFSKPEARRSAPFQESP